MNFRNFELRGIEVFYQRALDEPFACRRLLPDIQAFVDGRSGFCTRVVPAEGEKASLREVYCIPTRSIAKGVPDLIGLVLVEHADETAELFEIRSYTETSEADWETIVARAVLELGKKGKT